MTDDKTDLDYEEQLSDDGFPICPYTKSVCHTPYLDCVNDCPRCHIGDDW